jgi:hypothetical protein
VDRCAGLEPRDRKRPACDVRLVPPLWRTVLLPGTAAAYTHKLGIAKLEPRPSVDQVASGQRSAASGQRQTVTAPPSGACVRTSGRSYAHTFGHLHRPVSAERLHLPALNLGSPNCDGNPVATRQCRADPFRRRAIRGHAYVAARDAAVINEREIAVRADVDH